jgi:site-specific DNA-methyltransferase (adenine-specific)
MADHNQIKYRLVFADPPFGIGVNYDGEYNDNMTEYEYEVFTHSWMRLIPELLLEGGRLYVHVPDQCVFAVLKAARELDLIRDEWIIWHYRFGQHQKGRYINGKCHGLVFTDRPEKLLWFPEDVLVDSDRASKYNDPRTEGTENPGKRVPLDVWGIPSDGPFWGRVNGNSKERRKEHENQLPEVYLKRILLGYTSPDDWVLDPFGGSGTTVVVARSLGRPCVTIEQSARYAESIAERVMLGAVR